MPLTNRYLLFILSIVLVACTGNKGDRFEMPDVKESGISFVNELTPTDDLNILDYLYFYNGGGVAIGDINQDGLPDIYFSGNQVKNALYLNKGDLNFEDITERAGVAGNSSWNTGAVMGDVNGDGLLDIYVCAVVGIKGFDGYNELFINNGDLTFTESAAEYGLDFDSYSSSAAFLDYDLDGDLDIYLLNHAVHTQESFGNVDLRYKRNEQTGDKLLRNDGGKFTDVSEEAGIYGGVNGYGLGVAIADFNSDGYPDIYVGNDFHEDDYYYLNNGDGTFREKLRDNFGQITRFSMGNDVADINGDGKPDILSLDMLPEDEYALKSTEGDEDYQILKIRTERYGYHYQFTRNMLHINRGDAGFAETALISGIAATDWSWSALFEDFDQDGSQDLFISNGIPKRPNDLDFINFVSNEQIQKKINNTRLVDQQGLDMMPSGKVHNYVFQGSDSLNFKDMSGRWMPKDTLFSGATALGDLDNDGDMDLVVNNIDHAPALYINKNSGLGNYLNLQFRYKDVNPFGIGTKVFAYSDGEVQYKELYTVRGFQASSQPLIHFGFGPATSIDSLRIIWPDKTYQVLRDIPVNQLLTISPENTKPFDYRDNEAGTKTLFKKVPGTLGIDFNHREDPYVDFNRQKLIPYKISDRGPAFAKGDLNNDGRDDLYFGSSKFTPSAVFLQSDSAYVKTIYPELAKDSILEEVSAAILDLDNDGRNDIYLATGGGDFFNNMPPLMDRYYLSTEEGLQEQQVEELFDNASVVAPHDIDDDGDPDIFIGNHAITNDFGKEPTSYLLRNDRGKLVPGETGESISGMITDAIWDDFDGDGKKDLIVVGEWMSPRFFSISNGKLTEKKVIDKTINGLWQAVAPYDIDNDGDTDYLLGNWGMNSKFHASQKEPLKMYYGDLDGNGSTETITALSKDGKYYPVEGLDILAGQMVSLRKKFTSYKTFAGKTMAEIFEKEQLQKTELFEITELRSGYLENRNGQFHFVAFGVDLQLAPITAFLVYDLDGDGDIEALTAGNYFGVKPYHGRFGSFSGAVIENKNDVFLGHELGLDLSGKSVRHLTIVRLNEQPYLLVTYNNAPVEVYSINKISND